MSDKFRRPMHEPNDEPDSRRVKPTEELFASEAHQPSPPFERQGRK